MRSTLVVERTKVSFQVEETQVVRNFPVVNEVTPVQNVFKVEKNVVPPCTLVQKISEDRSVVEDVRTTVNPERGFDSMVINTDVPVAFDISVKAPTDTIDGGKLN